MPCYDGLADAYHTENERRLHKLTAMMCRLCGRLETAAPGLVQEDKDLNDWWIEHQAHDARVAAICKKVNTVGYHSLTYEEKLAYIEAKEVKY